MVAKIRFYSVQSAEDGARLGAGGEPWPGGLQRANLGPGFYTWDSSETAEAYRQALLAHGAPEDLIIVAYEIAEAILNQFKKLDLTQMKDDEVNDWLAKYSQYGEAQSHGLEYVVRNTGKGTEHYFAASVFGQFAEVK